MSTPRKIEVLESIFDPWKLQQDYQAHSMQGKTDYGATASFIGTMRDFNEGDDVTSMTLEHYPKMTEKQLNEIIDEASNKWSLLNVLVVHRVGKILPAEPIVLVTVWSSHRVDAFEACRVIMEDLKHKAPFWKQETLKEGSSRWVEENTVGY
ncbi:MAG: molybdenum cofactor biosynthesis protein MoaE [Cocleimonas sp.]|nr:molybdenum cofactor biosynthesis protein MoaE [Cocleimonas sp.]